MQSSLSATVIGHNRNDHHIIKVTHPAQSFDGCWFLSGATATGKTEVGLELAKLLDAEIVSMDSMAIYRHMDIGTAKPTDRQRKAVPHHLIDIRDPHEEFSVAEYLQEASRVVAEIRSRNKQVLFVGGTPLYLKAMLRGLDDVPQPDPEFRRQVEAELSELAPVELHERVQQIDPVAADQIHPNDTKRLIRVLEVFKQTGRPLSHFQSRFDDGPTSDQHRALAIRRPRAELHARIDTRVEKMFSEGLVEEVRAVAQRPGGISRTAKHAVGYIEVLEHLAGQCNLATAKQQTKVRTHRFARKQETWFRSLPECRIIDVHDDDTADVTAAKIVSTSAGQVT